VGTTFLCRHDLEAESVCAQPAPAAMLSLITVLRLLQRDLIQPSRNQSNRGNNNELLTNGAHAPHTLWRRFDTHYRGVEDMDMGEFTRQELDAKLDAVKAWIDSRFAERRMETQFAELNSNLNARCDELEATMQRCVTELIKWIVGTALAFIVILIAIMALFVNMLAVAAPENAASATSAIKERTTKIENRVPLLHRLKRHDQS
jgi:hypothetical protein